MPHIVSVIEIALGDLLGTKLEGLDLMAVLTVVALGLILLVVWGLRKKPSDSTKISIPGSHNITAVGKNHTFNINHPPPAPAELLGKGGPGGKGIGKDGGVGMGGKGGAGGLGDGGAGGDGIGEGPGSMGLGGEGGSSTQPDGTPGHGGRSPMEVLHEKFPDNPMYQNRLLPDGTMLWDKGRGGQAGAGENGPNWTVHAALNYLKSLGRDESALLRDFEDAASLGGVKVWGRIFSVGTVNSHPLQPVPREHWQKFTIDLPRALYLNEPNACRTQPRAVQSIDHDKIFQDLRVNEQEVRGQWPL